MNLAYLDKVIPSYWTLSMRYWLPFFETPSEFYFKSRSFIDKLNSGGHNTFPLKILPNFIFILDHYAKEEIENKLAQQTIAKIFYGESIRVTQEFLSLLFTRFNPDFKEDSVLSDVFRRIPDKFYIAHFNTLNAANCSSKNLKWYARFKNKVKLKDRIALILSLHDETLRLNQSTILQLAIQEVEDQLLNQEFGLNNFLNTYVTEPLLVFIFTRDPTLIFSPLFTQTLINQLLKRQHRLLTSYILASDSQAKLNFVDQFLTDSDSFQPNNYYFISLCSEKQWSAMIDQLMISIFNVDDPTQREHGLKENVSTENKLDLLLLLIKLQEQYTPHPIKLFQFLAIQSLRKKQFDLEKLKIIFNTNQGSLEYRKNFSIPCQSTIIEKSILVIKIYIKNNFMVHIDKKNTRHDIHRAFYKFFNNEYTEQPFNVAKLILEKLPEPLHLSCAENLHFLQQLLSKLYLVLDDPLMVNYKNRCLITQYKSQQDDEERIGARRELLERIRDGKQSSIAYQRMNELFGSEAPTMQEKWKKTLGIHFFDANDKEEYKAALKAAAEMTQFNREYNDFSCLSHPTLTVSYSVL